MKRLSMKRMFFAFFLLLTVAATAGSLTCEPVRIVGKVIGDADGEPIPGALVLVKGDNTQAVTDPQGLYALEASACDTLVFRFLSYEEQQLPVAGRRRIDVRMRVAEVNIDSVVVRCGWPE